MSEESKVVELSGFRTRLKNRRVHGAWHDGSVWLKWEKLADRKSRKVARQVVRLSPEAAAATVAMILHVMGLRYRVEGEAEKGNT